MRASACLGDGAEVLEDVGGAQAARGKQEDDEEHLRIRGDGEQRVRARGCEHVEGCVEHRAHEVKDEVLAIEAGADLGGGCFEQQLVVDASHAGERGLKEYQGQAGHIEEASLGKRAIGVCNQATGKQNEQTHEDSNAEPFLENHSPRNSGDAYPNVHQNCINLRIIMHDI